MHTNEPFYINIHADMHSKVPNDIQMRRPFDFYTEWRKVLIDLYEGDAFGSHSTQTILTASAYLPIRIEAHRIVAARFYKEDGEQK